MSENLFITPFLTIPSHELQITTSKSGGAGGQHVNKTESRITVRWNIGASQALGPELKERILKNLSSFLTDSQELIINADSSRSQYMNKQEALERLAHLIKKGLKAPKIRKKSTLSKAAKEKRKDQKQRLSSIKKNRVKRFDLE